MCCFVFIHKIRVIKELHTVADLDISEHCYEKHGKNAATLCKVRPHVVMFDRIFQHAKW